MNERRGPWYLLTGFVIGLGLGLLYAWVLNPVEFVDTDPASLHPQFKDTYRVMIALAYQADSNLGRAYERLKLLGDADAAAELSAQAQRLLAAGGAAQEAQALALLATALEQRSRALPAEGTAAGAASGEPLAAGGSAAPPTADSIQAVQTATAAPSPTLTPMATFTPRPTSAAAAAAEGPFLLRDQQRVCDPQLPNGLLQVELAEASGRPLPGVKITITWEGGEEFFYTGLYPQISAGYADFILTPGVIYSLRAGQGGETVSGLSAPECTAEDGSLYAGGWRLRFEQP